ncbi:ARF GTPase-activating protein GIT2-like isoform X2 [Branchiostoma floridae]|uniref:ARF GTPase-activating protein GIT2-like isoform X2 n=1 Tax=Branchiostoma floridae TaxID=7739 RepID=A0A9J7KK09_BRAFL|nr:ARF GTPase-activating protein GIT2-like isoform X2 [Branchiostoma floridae]
MTARMNRRMANEVCGDCGTAEPGWASINRGVLLCDDCCSVHRSLGRHISQVRSLQHSNWASSLLTMVQQLVTSGANSIWEHSLLDPAMARSTKRKPSPNDSLSTKADFTKAKYQYLAFVHRLPCREDDDSTMQDLSKQLHSSVRTGSLETSLRLLSLGADVNFFHPERGATPLHVAASAGQTGQVELLIVHGADPGALDINSKTPIQCAKEAGFSDLYERLVACQFELTDRLIYYLCGRKPDHLSGQHFIIPEMADSSLDRSELAKQARKKLQALSNRQFEELAMDVYDEVDRREMDAVWLTTQNHSALVMDRTVVPFLPVNPEFSSTRNQGRQKLARFNAREFATLIIDILIDARRRQQPGGQHGSVSDAPMTREEMAMALGRMSGFSDEEPVYDSVASDEDDLENQRLSDPKGQRAESMASSDLSDGPITLEEYLQVKKALAASDARVQQLIQVKQQQQQEISLLQSMVQKLMQENANLRTQVASAQAAANKQEGNAENNNNSGSSRSGRDRPISMFETRAAPKELSAWKEMDKLPSTEDLVAGMPSSIQRDIGVAGAGPQDDSKDKQASDAASDYDNNPQDEQERQQEVNTTGAEPVSLPSQDDVVRKTEQITKNIQELLRSAQESKHDSFIACSEKILTAVREMAALFPEKPRSETIRLSLQLLTSSAQRLQVQCHHTVPTEPEGDVDMQLLTQQVIQCAYDIAKAAKQLVTIFQ